MNEREESRYEVQCHQNGHWINHGRFDLHERSEAMKTVRNLEQRNPYSAYRVLFINYNAPLKEYNTAQIYRNPIPEGYEPVAENLHQRKKPLNLAGYLLIVLNITLIASLAGILAAFTLGILMYALELHIGNSYRLSLFLGAFSLAFLAVAPAAYKRFMANYTFEFRLFRRKKAKTTAKATQTRDQYVVSRNMTQAAVDIAKMPQKHVPDPVSPQDDLDRYSVPLCNEAPSAQEILDGLDEPEAVQPSLSPAAIAQQQALMSFLQACLRKLNDWEKQNIAQGKPNIGPFPTTGLLLFMSGALKRAVFDHQLSAEDRRLLGYEISQALGMAPEQWPYFSFSISNYKNESHHNDFIEKGASAYKMAQDNDPSYLTQFLQAAQTWSGEKHTPLKQTDQSLYLLTTFCGNDNDNLRAAYELIVRTSLAQFDGREMSRTKRQLHIAFLTPEQAAQAALDMWRRMEDYRRTHDSDPLSFNVALHMLNPSLSNPRNFYLDNETIDALSRAPMQTAPVSTSQFIEKLLQTKNWDSMAVKHDHQILKNTFTFLPKLDAPTGKKSQIKTAPFTGADDFQANLKGSWGQVTQH